MLLSVFCFVAYAQKTVTGTVVDATGEPMIGVSILVDGTTIGAVTDFDGNFTIKDVPENGVLKISYIGYKDQKIAVAGKSSFNVTMQEDAAALDEIVVVGYGTMKKKDLTGSVSSVKTDDLQKVAGANALSAMQAKVPGVDLQQTNGGQAGEGVSMTLRGNRSLLAGNGPLVIVDGVEYGSTLDIPASDIESMDILKDAASTAIYGTKGANGVILITTKRGKAGKTSVSFNGYLSFNSATGIVKPMYGDKEVQRLLDKKDYETAAANGWNFSKTATPADVLTFTLEDGTETLSIYNDKSYTDWLDMVLTNSVSQNYEVAVQGGNEKTNFNVSLAAMDDKGLLKGDKYKRYTGRVNIDHQINKIVKIGASLSYAYKSNDKMAGGVFNQAQKMTTITHAYLNDGSINATPNPWYAAHCSPLLNDDGAYQRNIESSRFFGRGPRRPMSDVRDMSIPAVMSASCDSLAHPVSVGHVDGRVFEDASGGLAQLLQDSKCFVGYRPVRLWPDVEQEVPAFGKRIVPRRSKIFRRVPARVPVVAPAVGVYAVADFAEARRRRPLVSVSALGRGVVSVGAPTPVVDHYARL